MQRLRAESGMGPANRVENALTRFPTPLTGMYTDPPGLETQDRRVSIADYLPSNRGGGPPREVSPVKAS
ncbi:hypothetical protein DESC_940017 [Desulfosarcina cetonica]|nr:hypothetical protein DESC_940017 [Desulfosarcina cetonica]